VVRPFPARSPNREDAVLARELEYHEKLYSGFAQSHFARPAVRALRENLVRRILKVTGAGPRSRVLSLGCGIGDTELLLAPHVSEIVGVDLSPAAVRQAREDARRAGVANVRFVEGLIGQAMGFPYDVAIAIFFLHHLSDEALAEIPSQVAAMLATDGLFYSLDPSRMRLSGMAGRLMFPRLMKRYQSADERELDARQTADLFTRSGYSARFEYYDFVSSPLAGLLPGWAAGYKAARLLDEALVRLPGLQRLGSNFEVIAKLGRSPDASSSPPA
jgi:SAM-dependent methyltransferase